MKRFLAALALLCLSGAAHAQMVAPFDYPQTIGTASVQILQADPQRRKIFFHNPNDTAKIAVCPVGPSRVPGASLTPIVAVINGAGCITLLPYDRVTIDNSAAASNPPLAMGSAWVGIASAPGSNITVLDWQ